MSKAAVVNLDQLAEQFDLPSWESIYEMNLDYFYERGDYAAREAEEEAEEEDEEFSEEDRDEAEMRGQEVAEREVYAQWANAVESAADDMYEQYGLDLEPKGRKSGETVYEFKIVPRKDWRTSADLIRETVNGVGQFYFGSLKEFLDSGPYTAREAVLSHLGYIGRHTDVYGSPSARRVYEASWH